MTYKNVTNIVLFSTIAVFALSFGTTNVFADNGYRVVGDTEPVLTFSFRDGVETHEFPVFTMDENFVTNSGVSFSVEGVVGESPLLHEALDEAYKYRFSNSAFDYQFKYFDVNANFVKNGESVRSLDYNNCRVDNYQVETLDSNDYESYFKEIGFAIVDKITFVCSGVAQNSNGWQLPSDDVFTDYGESEFTFANNMRTTVTFIYDDGSEKIQFPVFDLDSAFEESSDNVVPEFSVEGLLSDYTLLNRAVDNARQVSGNGYAYNLDFDVLVEFTNGESVIRGLEFQDCTVSSAKIHTHSDKEEGFIGKSAFVLVDQYSFSCSGLTPINMYYDDLRGDAPIWKTTHLTNDYVETLQNTDKGLDVISTFTFADGNETIEFSMFKQNEILTATESVNQDNGNSSLAADAFTRKTTYPTIEFRGIVGDYPILYNYVDENRKIQSVAGTQYRELVDIDVVVSNGEVLRGFNYVNCRATNYDVDTETNKDESYAKDKFALENIFDFECQGYHPNNPTYDTMFEVAQADTQSTNDLRNTDQWARGFFVE